MKNYTIGATFDLQGYMNDLNAEYKRRIIQNENNCLTKIKVASEVEWKEL